MNWMHWNLVERVGEESAEDCDILDCVFGYRRSSKTMI